MASSSTSLWPREHGAYVQLLVPLATALALGAPGGAAAALACGATLAFLASEPLRVAIGGRGARRQAEHGPRARRRLALLGGGALACGALGLALAPPAAPIAALVAVPLAAVVIAARRRALHTLLGELAAAIALAGAAAPIAIASGVATRPTLITWAAWALGFAATVVAVHHVLAHHRRPTAPRPWLALAATAAGLAGLVALAPHAAFAAPLVVGALAAVVRPPPATRLRTVGVVFLVLAVAAAALAIAT